MKIRFYKKKLKIFRSRRTISKVTVVVLIGVIGTYALIYSHADTATPYSSTEAESGVVDTPAQKVSDSTASGGEAVQFGPASSGTGNSCSSPFAASVLCMMVNKDAVDDGTNNAPYQNSAALVAAFNADIKYTGYNVGINNSDFGIPIYRVPKNQPLVPVPYANWNGCPNQGYEYDPTLEVPVPDGAVPATGTDHGLIVYQASTGEEWEFWEFNNNGNGTYEACDGGEISDVATSSGAFPTSGSQEASAGVSYLATLITETDVQAGSINHALAINLDNSCNGYIAPARSNYDCSNGIIPYGQYFRFPPGLAMPSGLTTLGQMIFTAIQKYGFMPIDAGGAIQVAAEDPAGWYQTTGTPTSTPDPITAAMDGVPQYSVIANLPWSQLQAVVAP